MLWMGISVYLILILLIVDGILYLEPAFMLTRRLYDKKVPGERRKAEELVHSMVDRALEMEGTCTGGTLHLDYR
jgi:hypothetical protein